MTGNFPMLNWQTFSAIYIRPGYTDMRKAINGLAIIAEEQMKLNIFDSNVFLFCGRGKRSLKVLYWDSNGFCLWQKRLEKDKYAWPRTETEAQQLTIEDLNLLLNGLDFTARHKDLKYLSIS